MGNTEKIENCEHCVPDWPKEAGDYVFRSFFVLFFVLFLFAITRM